MAWYRVHTVNDYYDGPRRGIADVEGGATHIFGDTYFASPVDEDLLAAVMEDWEIWLRWNTAFKRCDASSETHPALPRDRERHEALKVAIGDRLRVDRAHAKYLKARFKLSPHDRSTIVEWSTVDA